MCKIVLQVDIQKILRMCLHKAQHPEEQIEGCFMKLWMQFHETFAAAASSPASTAGSQVGCHGVCTVDVR